MLPLRHLLLLTFLSSCSGSKSSVCEDSTDGAFSKYSQVECSDFEGTPAACGNPKYNDDDFDSIEMCCSCGGGRYVFYQNCAVGYQRISTTSSLCEPCPIGRYSSTADYTLLPLVRILKQLSHPAQSPSKIVRRANIPTTGH
jgi:hypothetical protein